MKRSFGVFAIVLSALAGLSQQDPQFSMYQFNQMVINPAYAGARDVLAVVALRRQQWVGINGTPETSCLSLHAPVLNKKLGLGLTLLNDKIGPRNVIAVYGNVAYLLKLNHRLKLSFGVNAGYNRYQFNYTDVELKTGQLPAALFGVQNNNALDINSGLYLKSKTFFVGLSATHLNSPTGYFYQETGGQTRYTYQLKSHLFLTMGKSFTINDNLVLAPTVLVRHINGATGFDVNVNFLLHSRLWLGAFYRHGYGAGGLLQFYFNNRIRAGVSYDAGMGNTKRLGPSFEAMLGFDLPGSKSRTVDVRFL
jgi:type IX secretion system PorP/SprF family membrane protein